MTLTRWENRGAISTPVFNYKVAVVLIVGDFLSRVGETLNKLENVGSLHSVEVSCDSDEGLCWFKVFHFCQH
jgi:hypothetical protein